MQTSWTLQSRNLCPLVFPRSCVAARISAASDSSKTSSLVSEGSEAPCSVRKASGAGSVSSKAEGSFSSFASSTRKAVAVFVLPFAF